MSFTVKQIFPPLNLPDEVANRHRMAVGMRVRDSWNARYDNSPPKIDEEGVLVNSYDDALKDQASRIIKKYVSEVIEKVSGEDAAATQVAPKKKRPRITAQPVFQIGKHSLNRV